MALKVTPERIYKWKNKKNKDKLIRAISFGGEEIIKLAFEALDEISEQDAVDHLIEAAQGNRSKERLYAVYAMNAVKNKKTVPVLIKCLEDKKYEIRVEAVKALGNIKDERAVEPLLNAMPEEGDAITEQAAIALRKTGNHAVKPLMENLNTSKPAFVRRLSAEILGNIGNPEAIPALIQALDDYYPEIPVAAENALVKIGKPALEAVIKQLNNEKIASIVCRIIGKIGDASAMDTLVKMLKNNNKEAVAEAAYALGRIGHANAQKPLMETYNSGKYDDLSDEDALKNKGTEKNDSDTAKINRINRRVRGNIIFALGEIGDKNGLDVILDGLHNPYTRDTAIQAIIKLGDEAILKALQTDEWFYKDIKTYFPPKASPEAKHLKELVSEWEQENL